MYLCTSNFEKEIKKTIPFRITWKRIIHLGINLTREIQYLYIEYIVERHFKRPPPTKKNLIYMDQKIDLVKIAIFSKFICRFNMILIKIPMSFFAESPLIIKFIWEWKGSRISKSCTRTKLEDSHSQFQNLLQICSNKRAW